jgi:FAD/FMN-containing dehydrogenase/Fe-S oxidoreductase
MARLPVIASPQDPPTLPERHDLARALANAIEGEVRLGLHDRMLYATDASLYQVEPLGVVIPSSIDDAVRAVHACSRLGLPVLPRGGGTSLAGQCTNRAVVIDFSPRCRGIAPVDTAQRRVSVEAGVTVDDLNDAIAATGLFFAPDPATARHASIGGCIGNNAAGSRSIKYGRTSESIAAIDACLADGTRVRVAHGSGRDDATVARLAVGVRDVVRRHERAIRERFPKTVRRNAGYGLDMVLAQLDQGVAPIDVDLSPLLCGSEGTLAVTLGATLKLHPRPKAKALAVVSFASIDDAIGAVSPILSTGPSAVELLDDLVISLAAANTEYRRYVDLLPRSPTGADPSAVLYVEYFGATPDEVRDRIEHLRLLLPGAPMQAHTEAQAMLSAWKLRKAGEPLLHGIPGHRKPITFIEDNAIPVERLGEFVRSLRAIVESHGTRAAFWAHASVGVLHVRPLLDIHDHADRDRMQAIAIATADLARSLGGVMSGEHGDGRVRGPLLERFYGPELMGAFRDVKRLFDPRDLLNPGNIVDLSGTRPRPIETIAQSLRVEPSPGRVPAFPKDLSTFFDYDDQHGFDGAVEMCNGSGVCRKAQGGTMCPSYMATLDERHSTRGRGNALRLAITGQLDAERIWNDPDTIETLHLCLSCKACKTECPSNVDIARLKAEYTAQRYQRDGAPLAARIMGEIRTLNRVGTIAPGIANWMNTLAPVRAIVNRVLGLHPQRSLPKFSTHVAREWKREDASAARAGATARASEGRATTARATLARATTAHPTVALFGDCFTTCNESSIGLAARRVLGAFGYDTLLADAGCCGRAKISLGLLPAAIDEADATLARLGPLIDDASIHAILVAEPSCLSAFKDDWLNLKLRTPLEVRQRLAAKAFLVEDFLHQRWDQHPTRPKFREAQGKVFLHAHCHQKALWGAQTSAALLKRIVGDRLVVLDTGCCGMAGSFGYTRDRFDLSMKIAELALLPAVRALSDRDVLVAPGTSCRHQIHDGADRTAEHTITLVSRLLHD